MTMRVLVTGGAGFIGSHSVDLLVERGHDVVVLDSLQQRVHAGRWPAHLHPAAQRVAGDVRDRDLLARLIARVDSVLHLAAYQDYLHDYTTFVDTNAASTAAIFEIVERDRLTPASVVVASSQSVAGEGSYLCPREFAAVPPLDVQVRDPDSVPPAIRRQAFVPGPRDDRALAASRWDHTCPDCGATAAPLLITEDVVQPGTAYGISKAAAERLTVVLGARLGVSSSAMRYTYVQGARNSWRNAYSGLLRRLVLAYSQGGEPILYEDGRQLRDFVNVRDVAAANVLAVERTAGQRVYNVGGGRAVSVQEVADAVAKRFGRAAPRPAEPAVYRVGDTRHTVSDISRLRAEGWSSRHDTEHSIDEFLDWFGGQPVDPTVLTRADTIMREQAVVRYAGTR
jgi:dTDP-L-rhamnose 4-epimerase